MKKKMWTRFMDIHSGGRTKEGNFDKIFIEAPLDEAKVIFYNRFGHSPDRVSCTCCGEDYSVDEAESLEQASAYDRGCDYVYFRPNGEECPEGEGFIPGKGVAEGYTDKYVERPDAEYGCEYQTLDNYLKNESVLVVRAKEIKPSERKGAVPQQGYVWQD